MRSRTSFLFLMPELFPAIALARAPGNIGIRELGSVIPEAYRPPKAISTHTRNPRKTVARKIKTVVVNVTTSSFVTVWKDASSAPGSEKPATPSSNAGMSAPGTPSGPAPSATTPPGPPPPASAPSGTPPPASSPAGAQPPGSSGPPPSVTPPPPGKPPTSTHPPGASFIPVSTPGAPPGKPVPTLKGFRVIGPNREHGYGDGKQQAITVILDLGEGDSVTVPIPTAMAPTLCSSMEEVTALPTGNGDQTSEPTRTELPNHMITPWIPPEQTLDSTPILSKAPAHADLHEMKRSDESESIPEFKYEHHAKGPEPSDKPLMRGGNNALMYLQNEETCHKIAAVGWVILTLMVVTAIYNFYVTK